MSEAQKALHEYLIIKRSDPERFNQPTSAFATNQYFVVLKRHHAPIWLVNTQNKTCYPDKSQSCAPLNPQKVLFTEQDFDNMIIV